MQTNHRYHAPVDIRTGARHARPSVGNTRHDWYFDTNSVYQDEEGPLDAPNLIPSGGHRGLDCTTLTVGIAHVSRPA